MSSPRRVFNALVRTHHITSRKKIQRLKKAASHTGVFFVLIRSGGSPGMMYVEGQDEPSVAAWVSAAQALRYKDYQCVSKPEAAQVTNAAGPSGFVEVESVAEFGDEMHRRGVAAWWRKAMGYNDTT